MREVAKSGVGRHERMNRGSGIEGREERSKGIEIRIADAFAIIKPNAPFKLRKFRWFIFSRIKKGEDQGKKKMSR